ncbi:MAG TPA: hypothetical protein DD444_02540 [Citreicella sp.]|jgi:hypothetical protein|uniref:Uncharacterized protein n=1 Tax=Salipiger marinus TaxID=555512 RepID=A0A1G8UEE3_9RHOB|nr:hypothetical protein [Salipiger marinus]SDJ52206.1 hypothetical protein SAMN04487993_104018 [Salipiger marinus]HBM58054.1 hypothetical protein [Citreicella sp.]HBT01848.1 hypothetical protein [Citreicella sp.]|tara:strand:+ start:235 stop:645 length:411 start_codon:yes stop_codon:yes gene_type:complete
MIQTRRTHTSAQPLLRRVQPATPPTGKKLEEDEFATRWSAMAAAEGHRRVLPPSPPAPPPMTADGLRVGSAQAKILDAMRDGLGTRAELCDRAEIRRGMWSSALAQIRATGIRVTHDRIKGQTVYRLDDQAEGGDA